MTNREAHEEAAGMGLDDLFFIFNNINPDGEYLICEKYPHSKGCKCPDCRNKRVDGKESVANAIMQRIKQ